MALVFVLFVLSAMLMAAAGALLAGSSDLRATRNYRGAGQVHFVAESAVSEALQTINAVGVVDFQNDVVGNWSTLFGNGTHTFNPLFGFGYSVTPVASVGNPSNAGRLVATATGTENVRNVVVANVQRSNIPSTTPGAIYLANDSPTNATFNGTAFSVDGNDHNYTGGAGPGAPVPGISTRNATNTQEAINSLSSGQKPDVRGVGFSAGPPVVPSVLTSPAAPSIAQMNQIINDLLARPGVVTNNATQINGNTTLGTPASPVITHMTDTGGVTVKANGNASGAGILIVEGDLTVQGNFSFDGLVLVRGKTNVQNDPSQTDVTGNATLYGALWTQDINLVVGGSAVINYSSQALALANIAGGGGGGALPSPLVVSSLADCGQLPAGTGGCP